VLPTKALCAGNIKDTNSKVITKMDIKLIFFMVC